MMSPFSFVGTNFRELREIRMINPQKTALKLHQLTCKVDCFLLSIEKNLVQSRSFFIYGKDQSKDSSLFLREFKIG